MSNRKKDVIQAAALMNRVYDSLDMRSRMHDESTYEEVTYAEGRALYAISRKESLSLGFLALATGVKPSAASITLERLVGKGLAERKPGILDRRLVEITVTTKGRAVVESLDAWLTEDSAHMLDTLSDDEVAVFLDTLEKIAKGLAL